MPTVASLLVSALADHGVSTVWGVVGDALNPVTDSIRREDRIEWIGVRHEEAGAFAAGAQSQVTDRIGVCAGTVGPGSVHLLNGLYDAKKSHTPVLAICGQVPRAEIGSDYFQEVDNDRLFSDVAVFAQTVMTPEQLPSLLELAVNTAYARRGVAVLTIPGDVGGAEVPGDAADLRFVEQYPPGTPAPSLVQRAADALNGRKVTMLAGIGAREARDELLAAAEELAAPVVLSLKAKEGLERDNPYQVGQSGLIGNPAAQYALEHCDTLLMVGTDFPYPEWLPSGKTVIQIDADGAHIGRRTHVDLGLVGDAAATLAALQPLLAGPTDRAHLESSRERYTSWAGRQEALADPDHDRKATGRLRRLFDNPDHAIRPEQLADALDRHAADDAVFTTDTGMPTVWLSRFVTFRGTRRLLGSYNLGSMANALPQALGVSATDRTRQVVACAGDGGLTMLLGELITAVAHRLPVTVVVFDNSRLGMVKLEQEQGGLPEHGTELANPDLAAVARACGLHALRVEKPGDVDDAVVEALAHDGPSLLDVVVNADEISLPPRTSVSQAWGFAVAKMDETLTSRGGS
ncbi:thiamine pyrophosphate-dependent enzyme [Pseudonocardia endophytica]|uniref:Pyruvate dehydrogenase (Quinone) n=1 Tax=Pseudonocardia endophytica TaxID=401976 RepID=A0A4R1HG04_PSEEN|nr:thiamine pyrophosphate-dependent enzyme [Pseudonocardia endophytica]TCK21084.1 pyruvate dehydrogenase (quinone) [Pseudonocardia endophytica]